MVKYLILGAGPAGLACANLLKERGEESFLVLEKEQEAGGLCRSCMVGGYPIDMGGGHFLDTRVSDAQQYILKFMPESEWDRYPRATMIDMYGTIIDNPIEAHIWQLPLEEQVEYIKSVAYAGANTGEQIPEDFVSWIRWKLGDRIADNYMLPYNQKMFGKDLSRLGTYWLYKLPSVNLEDTILSCLERKMHGNYPAHTEFFYPKKHGFGEVWLRMAEAVQDKIRYGVTVNSLDVENRLVNGEYQAEIIINTLPWTEFETILNCETDVVDACKKFAYTSLEVKHFTEDSPEGYQWVYYPDPKLPYHRKFYRGGYLKGAHGGYFETNMERADMVNEEAAPDAWRYVNKYAYPCNTIDKPEKIARVLAFMKSKQIYGLGRWGEWEHLNADVVVDHAMKLMDTI